MPGEGFQLGARWPGRPEGIMVKVVSEGSGVRLFPTLEYRGIAVGIDNLDPASSTLRIRLTRRKGWAFGEDPIDFRVLDQDGWVVADERDQVYFSPYIDVDNPHLVKIEVRPSQIEPPTFG